MKKISFVFLAIILVAFSSCKKNEVSNTDIVGTWNFVSITADVQTDTPTVTAAIKAALEAQQAIISQSSMTITFNKDLTWTIASPALPQSIGGVYEIIGPQLTLLMNGAVYDSYSYDISTHAATMGSDHLMEFSAEYPDVKITRADQVITLSR